MCQKETVNKRFWLYKLYNWSKCLVWRIVHSIICSSRRFLLPELHVVTVNFNETLKNIYMKSHCLLSFEHGFSDTQDNLHNLKKKVKFALSCKGKCVWLLKF